MTSLSTEELHIVIMDSDNEEPCCAQQEYCRNVALWLVYVTDPCGCTVYPTPYCQLCKDQLIQFRDEYGVRDWECGLCGQRTDLLDVVRKPR